MHHYNKCGRDRAVHFHDSGIRNGCLDMSCDLQDMPVFDRSQDGRMWLDLCYNFRRYSFGTFRVDKIVWNLFHLLVWCSRVHQTVLSVVGFGCMYVGHFEAQVHMLRRIYYFVLGTEKVYLQTVLCPCGSPDVGRIGQGEHCPLLHREAWR